MDDTTKQRLARVDNRICRDRALYLKCIWAGHDGEAEAWEVEVDRLLDLRNLIERGGLTAAIIAELEAL